MRPHADPTEPQPGQARGAPTPGAPDPCDHYLTPYRDVLGRVGPRFEALLWANPQSQQVRFHAIAEMVDLRGRVVLDAGCGRGDFLHWLEDQGIPYAGYIGLDALPEMIGVCRERSPGCAGPPAPHPPEPPPACSFIQADFAADNSVLARVVAERSADLLLFCGSLNTFDQRTALTILDRAWDAIARVRGGVLVFNFLSDRCAAPPPCEPTPARRFDTLAMLRWALERTPLVSFRHDYLEGRDATIAVRAP